MLLSRVGSVASAILNIDAHNIFKDHAINNPDALFE